MTSSTTVPTEFSEEENSNSKSTTEQKAESLQEQLDTTYDTPNTYDPSGNPELDSIRELLKEKGLSSATEVRIRQHANKRSFPLGLQFETADNSKMVLITLGELARTAQHEKAVQYIYPSRIKHCLFGPHGIAKGYRLSNDIQVCWRREALTGELETTPCITSGRHRVTAIILLLQYMGIPWEKQKVMISTRIAESDQDFAQLIFDNNDSRKMVAAEKRNHTLGALGINTASKEAFYNDALSCVKHVAKNKNLCGDAFAAACRFEADGKPIEYADRLFVWAKGAFNKLASSSTAQRNELRSIVIDGGKALEDAAAHVEENLLKAKTDGRERFPASNEFHATPKALATILADYLNLQCPAFEGDEWANTKGGRK